MIRFQDEAAPDMAAPSDMAKPKAARRKPPSTKPAEAETKPHATRFDRKAYQRDLMRKRRATQGKAA